MEQNENQYDEIAEIDRKKVILFLIGGLAVILAAVILVIYLFADRTKASTGEGEAIRITPERVQQISDDVSKQVLDTLRRNVLTDQIHKAVSEQLKGEKIYEILSDGDVTVTAIGDDELRDVIAVLLEDIGISGDGILTEEQKKYIRIAVDKALQDALAQISVSQLLTEEERQRLEERLRQELSDTLKRQIQGSSYQLSGQELEKLKQSLRIESLIQGEVGRITKQQMETLKTQIISSVKKSIKTPVKGVDYFTDADIKRIQKNVLKEATKELFAQIEKLTAQISEIQSHVNTLTK